MKNKATNKKLQNKITKQCKNCEVKKEMGRCPYANRLECTDCNIIIAETVLSNYIFLSTPSSKGFRLINILENFAKQKL